MAAFATATSLDFNSLIEKIGHDGSEIVFPNLKEPLCRRAFHFQELTFALWRLGFAVTSFDSEPYGAVDEDHIYTLTFTDFPEVMKNSIGVGCGRTPSGNAHAFAWDGEKCYDPKGFIYPLEHYELYTFHAIRPL